MVKFAKAIKSGAIRARADLPTYGGKMDDEELIDWFSSIKNFFECEDIEENQNLKIAKSKLKGHAFYGGIVCKRKDGRMVNPILILGIQ